MEVNDKYAEQAPKQEPIITIEIKHGDRTVSFTQLTEFMIKHTPANQLTAQVKDVIGGAVNLLKQQLTAIPNSTVTVRR